MERKGHIVRRGVGLAVAEATLSYRVVFFSLSGAMYCARDAAPVAEMPAIHVDHGVCTLKLAEDMARSDHVMRSGRTVTGWRKAGLPEATVTSIEHRPGRTREYE